jgi:Undecaprenyl-phosphate glucose phosphotransferase
MSELRTFSSIYTDVIDEFGWATKGKKNALFRRIPSTAFVFLTVISEFLIILGLSLLVADHSSHGANGASGYLFISMLMSATAVFFMNNQNLYKIEYISDYRAAVIKGLKFWTLFFAGVAVIAFLTKTGGQFSRLWFIGWYISGLVSIGLLRLVIGQLFRLCVERGLVIHDVVVVGAADLASKFIHSIAGNRFGIRVSAVFDDDLSEGYHGTVDGTPLNGGIGSLLRYHKAHPIDTVVLASPIEDKERLRSLVRQLSFQPLNVRILPGPMDLEQRGKWCAAYGEMPGIHLMAITDLPIEGWGRVVKWLLDVTCATLALLLFAPVMLACVIGIKINSPGPVFFRQKRIGYRNRVFEVYKFRSMHVSACNTGKLTQRNDPRIFKFGQIMRKLSLDELPQLLNVLKGDMSLVGPRPHMPEARAAGELYFDLVAEYAARHRVKPGITGWAQVSGWRGPTETVEQIENRVRHDLYYIDNWSITLDLVILAKTVFVGFFGKNAF